MYLSVASGARGADRDSSDMVLPTPIATPRTTTSGGWTANLGGRQGPPFAFHLLKHLPRDAGAVPGRGSFGIRLKSGFGRSAFSSREPSYIRMQKARSRRTC